MHGDFNHLYVKVSHWASMKEYGPIPSKNDYTADKDKYISISQWHKKDIENSQSFTNNLKLQVFLTPNAKRGKLYRVVVASSRKLKQTIIFLKIIGNVTQQIN